MNLSFKFEYLLLTVAMVIVLVASTYKLSEAPAIWLDEGVYTQLGLNVAQTGQQAFQVAPGEFMRSSYISVGYPLIYPLALSYALFGAGVLQGRAVMVIFLLLFAAAAYWYARQLFGPWQAAWTLWLLVSFAELYGNGKSVLGEVPGLFFLVAALIALRYLEKSDYHRLSWWGAFGFFTGLCVATKPIFLLLPVALLVTLLVKRKSVPLSWGGFAVGLVALAVPLVYWAYTQLGPDTSVLSLLRDYINPYSAPGMQTVASQTVMQNIIRFFTETTPLYTALLMAAWGAALYLRRKAERISAAELSAFFFCVLVAAAYLRLPGWYRYLFPATAVALIVLPSATLTIFRYIKNRLPFLERVIWLPYAALFLLFCAQVYQVAFASYVAQYYTSTRTHDMTVSLGQLPAGSSVFLYDVPEVAVLLPTRNYYQYEEVSPLLTIGAGELAVLQEGIPDFIVTGRDIYGTNPALFAQYKELKQVNRYEILKKNL